MGEKGAFRGKLEQDVVAKGRIFPLFPQSFQHLTPTIHIGCGKKPPTTRFNTSSTTHSQPCGKPLPRMKPDTFRLFNIFPTPYYGYYNKFNKIDRSGDCIPTQNSIRTRKTKERIQFEHRM